MGTRSRAPQATRGEDKMLKPREVAAAVGISTAMLARLRQEQRGPAYVRLGHRTVRYRQRDVEAWKTAQRVTTGKGS
jgi:predicted DNA-binding transcriptional regulator AlpA